MFPKKGSDNEERKLSKLQFQLLLVFFLMLCAIVGIGCYSAAPIPIIIAIVFACIVFAFLIKEPTSTAWLRDLEIVILKVFQLKINRQEKQLHEMPAHIISRNDRPDTSVETNGLLDKGRAEYERKEYESAAKIYAKIDKSDPAYWLSRSNVLLCLVKGKLYERALLEADYIEKNCKDKKYLAQALINISEYLMYMSIIRPELEKQAFDNYLKAFEYDPGAIITLYYCWIARTAIEEDAQIIAYMVERHEDYKTLPAEFIQHFTENKATEKVSVKKEFVMNWKKIILTCALMVLLSVVASAEGGVLNGRF